VYLREKLRGRAKTAEQQFDPQHGFFEGHARDLCLVEGGHHLVRFLKSQFCIQFTMKKRYIADCFENFTRQREASSGKIS